MSPKDNGHVEEIMKSIVYRKKDVDGEKVEWLKIQWLRLRKDEPFKVFFKYSSDDSTPFRCLDIGKRSPRERRVSLTCLSGTLPQLYLNGHPIKAAKYRDLQSFIPMVHHAFYRSLLQDGSCDPDADAENDIVYIEDDDAQ
ncbi:hypothetical protein ElyMa_004153300 [Elysia marginata]|uniref:Ras-associating domain-containing protein n=1 Tax=Elysia marginata TaxID=1093978 RepID=A0AAV4GHI5_9GAST|nr:hypothetical protein ElyMa_004153300 [Elysia marginata]